MLFHLLRVFLVELGFTFSFEGNIIEEVGNGLSAATLRLHKPLEVTSAQFALALDEVGNGHSRLCVNYEADLVHSLNQR